MDPEDAPRHDAPAEPSGKGPRKTKTGRVGAARVPPPKTGRKRSRSEMLRLIDVAEEGVLLALSRPKIRELLGKAAGLPGPMSARTADKYLARVAKRHETNPPAHLEHARDLAERRIMRAIARLTADGLVKNEAAILRWETRLAALRGMDAPRDKEAIEAQAQAIVDAMLRKAQQEHARKQAEQEHLEDEKRRMIDVGEATAPVPGRDEG